MRILYRKGGANSQGEDNITDASFVAGKGTQGPNQRLRSLARERCIPLTVSIELGLNCNWRCVHCYNFDRRNAAPSSSNRQTLDDSEILGLIDAIASEGCLFLELTGGEPLLVPGLLRFVRRARAHAMHVTLRTNGSRVAWVGASELLHAGVLRLVVSLFGATAHTHDRITGVGGSFQAACEGIEQAQQAGIEVRLHCNIMKSNAHETGAMIDLSERLNCSLTLDPQITARYDGDRSPLSLRVDEETLAELYQGPLHSLVTVRERAAATLQCNCARSVCGVASTGDVYPCMGAPMRAGNIRSASFRDIWRHSPLFEDIRRARDERFTDCVSCDKRLFCARNSGVVSCNTGDYWGAEEWTCKQANTLRVIQQGCAND